MKLNERLLNEKKHICDRNYFEQHDHIKCQDLKFSIQQMLKAYHEKNITFNTLEEMCMNKKVLNESLPLRSLTTEIRGIHVQMG